MATVVCISDTHDRQHQIDDPNWMPDGDILIHAGDFSMMGENDETLRFLEWFNDFPHPHKILICGNHDWIGEKRPGDLDSLLNRFPGITYLNDSGCEVMGLKIWGSPIQPWFCSWAFNRMRGEQIQKHWDLIPNDTDILVTHGPVYGIRDNVWLSWNIATGRPRKERGSRKVGCEDLKKKVDEIKPKLHICGHIHCDRGISVHNGVTYVNASIVDESYTAVYKPITVGVTPG